MRGAARQEGAPRVSEKQGSRKASAVHGTQVSGDTIA
jgi:hypothetical protein